MLRLTCSRTGILAGLALSIAAASTTGCQLIAGIGGEESKGGTGGATSTGGGGTGGTTNPGGGGTGGLSGPCTPGESQTCYSGAAGTIDVGECKSGTAMCGDDAMWGACEGEVPPSIELCSSPKDENCDGLDCVVFVKTFADVEGRAVTVDAQGNIFAAITFSAGVDFGDGNPVVPVGSNDIAILEYDKSGALIGKRVFPGSGYQTVSDIVIAKDGSLAIGGTSDSAIDFGFGAIGPGAYVAKLDASMSPVWARAATGQFIDVEQLAFDALGNVFAAASGSSVDFGNGALTAADSTNFWVAKLDGGNGSPKWTKITKGEGFQSLGGIAVDPSNSLVVTGLNAAQYLGLSGTGAIVNDVYNGTGENAPFLVRLDPDGNFSDGKTLGNGPALDVGVNGLAVDKLGVSTIVGSFSGQISFQSADYDAGVDRALYILRDQTSGFDQTSKAFVQAGVYVYPYGMAVDSEGSVVLHGNKGGPLDLGGGLLPPGSKFIAKIAKDGSYRWARSYEIGDGQFRDMAVGSLEDETVLIGIYYGDTDLGTGVFTGSGMFLLKLGK